MRQWKQRVWGNGYDAAARGACGATAAACALACLVTANDAKAQLDTNPPLHNVMLLVDSSGSMEYANDGTPIACDQVDPALPASIAPTGTSQKSRWTQLVEVLTGDVSNFECYTQDRRSDAFRDEFKLPGGAGGVTPYDYNYHVPYHRMLSVSGANKCTVGAGVVDANPFAWGTTPFRYHPYNAPTNFVPCTDLLQSETGLLDAYRDRMRFGLMTFDTSIDPGTGVSAVGTPDYVNGVTGTWSYFLDWVASPDCNSNGNCAKGRPAGCATPPAPMEVGARNAAAPPWEGRMIPFGSPAATITEIRATNDHIQKALTAVRPFGATPINGMLSDASDFFTKDTDKDYVTGATSCNKDTGVGCFGPKYDGLAAHGCRNNYIILLTDGEPNLDLRPYCEGSDPNYPPKCPYDKKTTDIVTELANPTDPNQAIKTFVIGFAVSSVDTGQPQLVDCSKISDFNSDTNVGTFDPNNLCGASMDPRLSACCTLAKIAFYGGTGNAYFATNATELREAISDVFDRISGTKSTRTMPLFASNSNPLKNGAGAFTFFSEFHSGKDVEGGITLKASVWSGLLERERTECVSVPQPGGGTILVPQPQKVDADKGDRFSDNVNAADSSHPRTFYTVNAADDGAGNHWSTRTIRPKIPSDLDGLGTYGGSAVSGGITDFFAPKVPATSLNIHAADCAADGAPEALSDDACASKFMKWEIGVDPMPTHSPAGKNTRPNVFGAIYHSTPAMIGAPADFLRDESYTQFTVDESLRPPVLYTGTTDGQLHAFKVDRAPDDQVSQRVDTKANNEIWSFIPPAALPRIPAQFPRTQQIILDGAPVVKDVVFERNDTDAKSGGAGVHWHSVIVSSFGAGGTGYFALDVTNPVPDSTKPTTTGPQMLWQLTTDADGNPLFGASGGTPAIATLFFGQGSADPKEVAVAILPGGNTASATTTCPTVALPLPSNALVDTAHAPRDHVRCLLSDPARSLTIVRLDTGEVIRSFRREVDGPAAILPRSRDPLNAYTPLISAISGQPVVFPSETGAVADRAFVGDSEGLLWRVDLSSKNPKEWKMDLFFDAFTGKGANAGQPIATPPILSVDTIGNVTVAFSTGDQETFVQQATGSLNYLWSLLEDSTSSFQSKANWDLPFPRPGVSGDREGSRVSGPIEIFNGNLYFTTYNPPPSSPSASDQCSDGGSALCAMHYLKAAGTPDTGGAAANPPLPSADSTGCLPQTSQVIFGPGITQDPTCFAKDTYNDPYLGGFGHTSLSGINTGDFKIRTQTGMHGTSETGGQINTATITLQSPVASTRIDSWAAVVE